jgi:glycosyltransferase involved in cell wall biosynthesis
MKNENTICLVMIVRNEEDLIIEALQSCEKWISYWIILDSCSTDRTEEYARLHMSGTGIPGEYHQYTEPMHAGNKRTMALQLARDKADYLLMIDADNLLVVDGDPFHDLDKDCYLITKELDNLHYPFISLFRGDLPWHFVGVAHEYPELIGGATVPGDPIPGVMIIEASKLEGQPRHRSPRYYWLHALMMETEVYEHEPDLPDHLKLRYMFYIGQSYQCALMWERALGAYQARANFVGIYDEELYITYYRIAQVMHQMGRPRADVIGAAFKAWNYRPKRQEAAYFLMWLLMEAKLEMVAYVVGELTSSLDKGADQLFLEMDVYNEKFPQLFKDLQDKINVPA